MKKLLLIILSILLAVSFGMGQAFFLSKPNLDEPDNTYTGLASNGVTKIVAQGDSILWFATGGGLSKTMDFGETFVSYYNDTDSMARGGISAITVLDSIIWVAAVFDSTTVVGEYQTGGGLSVSKDSGRTWTYIPQPVDSSSASFEIWDGDTVRFLPITTPVQNTTWDISVTSKYVYIASWSGGVRRSSDFGATWERIPLPSDDEDVIECGEPITYEINPRDPQEGNHNHKGFSVLAYDDKVWVGTAGGINLGIVESDSCIRWRKYTAQNSAISGNFIVALARQVWNGKETIWAATLSAEGAGEYRAVSKTTDCGLTWSTTLVGERVYNFAFHNSIVYVCTESGLFKSLDGENWALFNPAEDKQKNEFIFSHDVYSAYVDTSEKGGPYLWIGTADGLAKTHIDSTDWEIYRASLSTELPNQPAIYAYPNPFSPTHHNILHGDGHVRVKHHLNSNNIPAYVNLEVYNFAMELVYEGDKHLISTSGDYNEVWNGRSNGGKLVANGTYFCKITRKENQIEKSYWTKLILIK